MGRSSPIRDRKTIADHVMDVMHAKYRDTSIDALLCRPFDAAAMALAAAAKGGRIKARDAQHVLNQLLAVTQEAPDAITAVNEICRAALASRKRGDLKRDRV